MILQQQYAKWWDMYSRSCLGLKLKMTYYNSTPIAASNTDHNSALKNLWIVLFQIIVFNVFEKFLEKLEYNYINLFVSKKLSLALILPNTS